MCNDLGHKINFDEARVLLASSDLNANNQLSLDEFLGMVLNDKDTPLNISLDKVTKLESGQADENKQFVSISQLH